MSLKGRSVEAEAPATSANLGPGFDIFAIALEEPIDRVRLEVSEAERLEVRIELAEGGKTPRRVAANAASAVAMKIAKEFRLRSRITVVLKKGVPIGVGLGSSAASSAAAALAMNESFGLGLDKHELIEYAAYGELVSSGSKHFDNVSAALMGGFVIVGEGSRGLFTKFEPPRSLRVCLATPRVSTPSRKTEYARSILPRRVELEKVVFNVSAASAVAAGFAAEDIALVGRGMKDLIVEPVRSRMIPGYAEVKRNAIKSGAAGICISGAGPTMCAFVDESKTDPKQVLGTMIESFRQAGTAAEGFVTKVGDGAHLIDENQ